MKFLVNSVCLACQTPFTQKKRLEKYLKLFCNRACSATYNNKYRKRNNNYIVSSNCLNCKKQFKYKRNSSTGKYCSNKCQREFNFISDTIKRAEQGQISNSKTQARVLTHLRGYKCVCCGISEWNNKHISLHVDHIDGNSDNNSLDNLRFLCPNCHAQTETFCGRNMKNTKRANYNKRYRLRKLALPLS
jgi:hypothetical protein